MNRDRRLTGSLRGQTDKVEPFLGFEVNNPWRVGFSEVSRRHEMQTTLTQAARTTSHLEVFLRQFGDLLSKFIHGVTGVIPDSCFFTLNVPQLDCRPALRNFQCDIVILQIWYTALFSLDLSFSSLLSRISISITSFSAMMSSMTNN